MQTPSRLDGAALDRLSAHGITVPRYDRQHLRSGIAHIGVGGFHRSHQAMALERLLRQGLAQDYAICGVGLLEGDRRAAQAFTAQDGLYSLSLKHPDDRLEVEVIGSVVSYVLLADDRRAVLEQLADPSTRIISLTITEGGYNRDRASGAFDVDHPAVRADLEHPEQASTVFGLVTAALALRRERGLGGVTIMSCDNLAGNGQIARDSFTSFARLHDPLLADWVETHVTFPGSMVDRITPVTTDDDRERVHHLLGVQDAWPVVAEPYFQWVLEDDFAAGRPPYERAGVQMVSEVEPFEMMKLRLANGGHQALCHLGVLAGFTYAHEASAHPAVAAYLTQYLDAEAAPTLHQVPGLGSQAFKDALLGRWQNAAVADSLDRIRTDSSDRLPGWLLPVAADNADSGGPLQASALACAAWSRAGEGRDDHGRPLPILDRAAQELSGWATRQEKDPQAFLRSGLFGHLAEHPRFSEAFLAARQQLIDDGALVTAGRFL